MLRNFADHPLFLLILVLLVVVVFGAKRLPDASRSLARSLKIFKTEVRDMKDDERATPGTPARPLEGKVVDADAPTSTPGMDRSTSTAPESQQHGA